MRRGIRAGEIFQVVPSRRFSLPCPSPLAAYDVLKKSNPSPYMFFMQDNDFTLFGASPESSLKYDAVSRQIGGDGQGREKRREGTTWKISPARIARCILRTTAPYSSSLWSTSQRISATVVTGSGAGGSFSC